MCVWPFQWLLLSQKQGSQLSCVCVCVCFIGTASLLTFLIQLPSEAFGGNNGLVLMRSSSILPSSPLTHHLRSRSFPGRGCASFPHVRSEEADWESGRQVQLHVILYRHPGLKSKGCIWNTLFTLLCFRSKIYLFVLVFIKQNQWTQLRRLHTKQPDMTSWFTGKVV